MRYRGEVLQEWHVSFPAEVEAKDEDEARNLFMDNGWNLKTGPEVLYDVETFDVSEITPIN